MTFYISLRIYILRILSLVQVVCIAMNDDYVNVF